MFGELLFLSIKGDNAMRSLLIEQYVKDKAQLPKQAIEYVEKYLLNIANDLQTGKAITSKFFPENPKTNSKKYSKPLNIYWFIEKQMRNGHTKTKAVELAVKEFGYADTRSIYRLLEDAQQLFEFGDKI